MWRLRWREWMRELSSDFPNQPHSQIPTAVLNSLRNAFLKTSGASGSLPRRLSAVFSRFDRSLRASSREIPGNLFAPAIVLSLILTMVVTSPQICRSQNAPAPSAADKDLAAQNQGQKR